MQVIYIKQKSNNSNIKYVFACQLDKILSAAEVRLQSVPTPRRLILID